MWPRVVEVMIGCWLAASPFIFRHPVDATGYWARDLLCAFAVVSLSLLSFWRPTRRAHLGILAVGLWLVLAGFSGPRPAPPALQNDLLVGLILLMLAVLPAEPEARWQPSASGRPLRS